jgi:hypothetical protein
VDRREGSWDTQFYCQAVRLEKIGGVISFPVELLYVDRHTDSETRMNFQLFTVNCLSWIWPNRRQASRIVNTMLILKEKE